MVLFEKVFEKDELTKKERIIRTLSHQEVDRVAIHEQLSFNPGVISMYTGKVIDGFGYTVEDVGETIAKTLDCCFPAYPPHGTGVYTDAEGFVSKRDNWTVWHVSRPFTDEYGARDWLHKRMKREQQYQAEFDPGEFRKSYAEYMQRQQALVGETVVIDFSINTGFCDVYDKMGLEIYTFFQLEFPDMLTEFMELSTANAIMKVNAAADVELSPVVLVAEDFATKQGPIFSPDFLRRYHFPYVKKLTKAWHDHGLKVIYHSDGNFKKCIPDLMECEVDGFYCLEPNCGMDIVELKNTYPDLVWAGGVDGVDLMERGSPDEVRETVLRHIKETNALKAGGMLLATSSEINPTVKPENFRAMVEAADLIRNTL